MENDRIILVLDDDKKLINLYTKVVNRFDLKTKPFSNGKDGLDYLMKDANNGNNIVGVISDFEMPVMNGLEFVQKARDYGYDRPILLHSGKYIGKDNEDELYNQLGVSFEMKGSIKYIKDFLNELK